MRKSLLSTPQNCSLCLFERHVVMVQFAVQTPIISFCSAMELLNKFQLTKIENYLKAL